MPAKKIDFNISSGILHQLLGHLRESSDKVQQLKKITKDDYPSDNSLFAAKKLVRDIALHLNHVRTGPEIPVANACKKFRDSLQAIYQEAQAKWEVFVKIAEKEHQNAQGALKQYKAKRKKDPGSTVIQKLEQRVANAEALLKKISKSFYIYKKLELMSEIKTTKKAGSRRTQFYISGSDYERYTAATIWGEVIHSYLSDGVWFVNHQVTKTLATPLRDILHILRDLSNVSVAQRTRVWKTERQRIAKMFIELSKFDAAISVAQDLERISTKEQNWVTLAFERSRHPGASDNAIYDLDKKMLGEDEARKQRLKEESKKVGITQGTTIPMGPPVFDEEEGDATQPNDQRISRRHSGDTTVVDDYSPTQIYKPRVPVSPKLPPSMTVQQMRRRRELQKRRQEQEDLVQKLSEALEELENVKPGTEQSISDGQQNKEDAEVQELNEQRRQKLLQAEKELIDKFNAANKRLDADELMPLLSIEDEEKARKLLKAQQDLMARFHAENERLDRFPLEPLPDDDFELVDAARGSQIDLDAPNPASEDTGTYHTPSEAMKSGDTKKQAGAANTSDSQKTPSGRQKTYKDTMFTFSAEDFTFFQNLPGYLHLFDATKAATSRSFALPGEAGEYHFVTKPLEGSKLCLFSSTSKDFQTRKRDVGVIKFARPDAAIEAMRSAIALYDIKPGNAECFFFAKPKPRAEFWSDAMRVPSDQSVVMKPSQYHCVGLRCRVVDDEDNPLPLQQYNLILRSAAGTISLSDESHTVDAVFEGQDLYIKNLWLPLDAASSPINVILRAPVRDMWTEGEDLYEIPLSLSPMNTVGSANKVKVSVQVEHLASSLSKKHLAIYEDSKEAFSKLMFVKMYPYLRDGETYRKASRNPVVKGPAVLIKANGKQTDEIPLGNSILVPKGRYVIELYQQVKSSWRKKEVQKVSQISKTVSESSTVWFKNLSIEKYKVPGNVFSSTRGSYERKMQEFVSNVRTQSGKLLGQAGKDKMDLSVLRQLLQNDFYNAAHFVFQGSKLTQKLRDQLIEIDKHFRHESETADGRPSVMAHILHMNLDEAASKKVADELSKIAKDLSIHFKRRAVKYDAGSHRQERSALLAKSSYYASWSGRSGRSKIFALLQKASAQAIVKRLESIIDKKSWRGKELAPTKRIELFHDELLKSIKEAEKALEEIAKLEDAIQEVIKSLTEQGTKVGVMKRILGKKAIGKQYMRKKYSSVAQQAEKGKYSIVNHIQEIKNSSS